MEEGLRVVRGPDWKWGNQDDGEGHLGTVVEIGKDDGKIEVKSVYVQWDYGCRANYRVGYQDNFDLRVFDNAQIAVEHPRYKCDGCQESGISGILWICTRCNDYDLCSKCYMSDEHDLAHPFLRLETPDSDGVEVPKREGARKVEAKGIFIGARVMRGPDWDLDNQDGGNGKTGKVTEISDWAESGHSRVTVEWATGQNSFCRVGHKGKVDLKYTQEATGGFYYPEHLPILGKTQVESADKDSGNQRIKAGDMVKVHLNVEEIKVLQQGHGGWNPDMAEVIGRTGTVQQVTERGDITIQYEDCNNRWTFNPEVLTKVTFSVGDMVKISDDMAKVKDLQKGHGEWADIMQVTLGKVGKITKIDLDGDLRVDFQGLMFTYNPRCVSQVSSAEGDNSVSAGQTERASEDALLSVLGQIFAKAQDSSSGRLVIEAAQGHLEAVKEILDVHPERVNHKSNGKTALQVSCHQGYIDIVRLLLSCGANTATQDDDGDTALHFAVFGNQPEIVELLLNSGAQAGCVNKGNRSALHVAVIKQFVDCVTVLLKYKCNVNIQDTYGDTALHDAIFIDNHVIIDQLVSVPEVDFSLTNKRGFNVLHHASLKGGIFATRKLLSRTQQFVNVKKEDGFAALHLAALNGHYEITETLISQSMCEVDIRNNRLETPLHLSINKDHYSVVELLLSKNASVETTDEDGDTALHLALMRRTSLKASTETDIPNAPAISQILGEMSSAGLEKNPGVAVACLLIQKGADISRRNHEMKTPLDLVSNSSVVDFLQKQFLAASLQRSCSLATGENPEDSTTTPDIHQLMDKVQPETECSVCSDAMANVVFEPCGHYVACIDCAIRMKKCILCKSAIVKKIGPGSKEVSSEAEQVNIESLHYLETQIQKMKAADRCSICMEQKRSVAFLCGHGSCVGCARLLDTCPICRKPISKKISLY